MSENFKYQREHLREWAAGHIVECDALASGLLQSPFSTAYFGDHKAMRLTGSLPWSGTEKYTFFFYPGGTGKAVNVVDIPRFGATVHINKPGVIKGTMVLNVETGSASRRFVVVEPNLTASDGKIYNKKYYLFTLPPISSQPDSEGEETLEYHDDELGARRIPVHHIPIGFLPAILPTCYKTCTMNLSHVLPLSKTASADPPELKTVLKTMKASRFYFTYILISHRDWMSPKLDSLLGSGACCTGRDVRAWRIFAKTNGRVNLIALYLSNEMIRIVERTQITPPLKIYMVKAVFGLGIGGVRKEGKEKEDWVMEVRPTARRGGNYQVNDQ